MTESLRVLDPATGDVVGTHEVADAEAVAHAVARAREAAPWWADLGHPGRRAVLEQWKAVIARRMPQLADLVHRETGKPHGDALIEVALVVDHLAWAARNAGRVLGPRKVGAGVLALNHVATVEYLPLGVVGVIGPWNYPVFTPMGSVAYALAAGNTVVLKPSELTPGCGVWLADSLREVVPDRALLQVVVGYADTGAALCRSGVDKLAFTGSASTGRTVMAACAETLTPVLIEAGGKDALIVDEDADVEAAADAAAWGAFSNAGQTCAGVERVYVHETVYDAFMTGLTERARALHAGSDPEARIGPMTQPRQVEVVRRHIDDALARGGRAVVGGPEAVGERFVQPTVLTDVPPDSTAITEETFAPTVTVTKVADMDEAVALANATRYGLGSSVFSASRGPELARRLRTGMTAVNAVISFVGIPALPFGGVGESGFGRVHGEDGLKEFTYAKAVAQQRFRPALPLASFTRTERHEATLTAVVAAVHGRTNQLVGRGSAGTDGRGRRGPLAVLPARKRHLMEP